MIRHICDRSQVQVIHMAKAKAEKARRHRGRTGGLVRQLRARPKPLWLVVAAHVLALGAALVLYALPHHVIPMSGVSLDISSSRVARNDTIQEDEDEALEFGETDDEAVEAETSFLDDDEEELEEEAAEDEASQELPEADEGAGSEENTDAFDLGDVELVATDSQGGEAKEEKAAPKAKAAAKVDEVGSFRVKFADKFSKSGVERTAKSYRSKNLNVRYKSAYVEALRSWVYVADIYIADISCLKTVLSKNTYGRGYTEWITRVARRTRSVMTMNGDYYGCHDTGVVIRNGTLFRNNKTQDDVAVLYWDGSMKLFPPKKFNAMKEIKNGAYQAWCFGPALLDGKGNPLKSYNCNSHVAKKNPRSAIGYFEPGHYCFVVVDGRNDASRGASIRELARFMAGLGCKWAYNLDGGQTSLLAAGTELLNKPSDGGRSSSDYILILDRTD